MGLRALSPAQSTARLAVLAPPFFSFFFFFFTPTFSPLRNLVPGQLQMVSVSSFVNIWHVSEIQMNYSMKKTNNKLNELNMFFSKIWRGVQREIKENFQLVWRGEKLSQTRITQKTLYVNHVVNLIISLHNWRRVFFWKRTDERAAKSREEWGGGLFAVRALSSARKTPATQARLHQYFFIFIFQEPLSKSALYHAFNVCEVSRHILFNRGTKVFFMKTYLLVCLDLIHDKMGYTLLMIPVINYGRDQLKRCYMQISYHVFFFRLHSCGLLTVIIRRVLVSLQHKRPRL